jgi:hypothetical protein
MTVVFDTLGLTADAFSQSDNPAEILSEVIQCGLGSRSSVSTMSPS